jgi:calcineurin-like phosphoesterase family protein
MEDAFIENHNKVVKPKDITYFIGDIAFGWRDERIEEYFKKLNGAKVFITGNHDRFRRVGNSMIYHRIHEVKGEEWGGYNPTLCHYPMLSWNASFHGTFQLHGHTHGMIEFDPQVRRLDVGVDCWKYAPIAWEDIVEKLSFVPTPRSRAESKGVKVHGDY